MTHTLKGLKNQRLCGSGLLVWAVLCGWMLSSLPLGAAQEQPAAGEPAPKDKQQPSVAVIPIPLPIQGLVDTQVMQQVDHVLKTLPARPRPILIFKFEGRNGETGENSQFERALALARFLTSERLVNVRTVAYLPHSVMGHAVLPVMACEQIIMHPDAELGNAGIGETAIDATLRRAYVEITERRRVIPPAFAIGMLDRAEAVSRVQTADGVRFVLADELAKLQQDGVVTAVDTVVREGDLGLFAGRDLRVKYGLVSHLVKSEGELADALEVPRSLIDDHPLVVATWKPIEVVIDGPIHPRLVTQIVRGAEDAVTNGTANLLLIRLRSGGGNLRESLRLANFLALDLDPKKMRSVVFVRREARGDAALVALAADDLIVTPDALIGGPGNGNVSSAQVAESQESLQALAKAKQREWSLAAGLLDPKIKIYRWTHERSNEVWLMSDEERDELPNAGAWQRGELLDTSGGLKGLDLEGTHWLHAVAENEQAVAHLYGWEGAPLEIKSNWALNIVEFLANPRLAFFLLAIAWAMLMIEMSAPGIGVPGFISGLCFLLFFWSQFLHGNAGVLEILLFLFGFACVAIEIFVVPGIGIFGFGGGLLIVASIILASQTFVVPMNSYQLRQLPLSLATIAAAAIGGLVAAVLAHRYLPRTPYLNRLLLAPPEGNARDEIQRRESFGDWTQLLGKRGQATTPLVPAGKARIGEELVDVLSEGELIDRGSTVEVIEVQGTRVIVRQVG